MIRIVLVFLLFFSYAAAQAQEPLISNVYNRTTTSLNGDWKYIVDPYENGYYNYRYEPFDKQSYPSAGAYFMDSKPKDSTDLIEYDFDKVGSLKVPGDWNSQKPELLYYEGTLWYRTTFDYNIKEKSNRLHLYFEASNYKTEVYLNGQKLGTHIGGFTPFNFEITKLVKEKNNSLVVKGETYRDSCLFRARLFYSAKSR